MKILVLGYIVRGPLGGLAWHHLQYVLGLARLGHDVFFLEDSEDYEACYDPARNEMSTDATYGLRFAARTFARLGMPDRWAYYDAHRSCWRGPAGSAAPALIRQAELLLNVSGVNPLRGALQSVPIRALIDTDPAFTQLRHLQEPAAAERAREHNVFFTFAENWQRRDARMPDDGLDWHATRQPVVLSAWPLRRGRAAGPFTTVMQWESYPDRWHDGRRYGTKAASFPAFLDLPQRVGGEFRLAVGSRSAPHELLRAHGWQTIDPRVPTRTPWSYQRFIRDSAAEFSVAKHAYVTANTGWFSERSAAYLASGRPVVTQDTGLGSILPAGEGLHVFNTVEEAAAAIEDVRAHYQRNARAARMIARSYFGSDAVLSQLLNEARALTNSAPAVH